MADTKLTDLPSLSAAAGVDNLYIVNLQENPAGESQKITVENFFGNINVPVNIGNTLSAHHATVTTLDVEGGINSQYANIDYLYTTNIDASAAHISTLTTDLYVQELSTTVVITYSGYNSTIYNVNTVTSAISVIFPDEIPDGFNMGLVNLGTNTIYISSTQTPYLCASSTTCSKQFGGIFIYKANGLLFAVGALD